MTFTLLQPQLQDHAVELPYFADSDTGSRYRKNLALHDHLWPWRHRVVTYTVNSVGLRAPELTTIDWSQCIVCFGCSMTFGTGVSDLDTWPQQLSQQLGVHTVNMGQPGGSVQLMWANSVRMIAAGIRPRAVVYYWPDSSRSCEIQVDDRVVNWGSWRTDTTAHVGQLGTAWMANAHHHTAMAHLFIQSLQWSVPRLDFTWCETLAHCAEFVKPCVDLARDMRHPGPQSHAELAAVVAKRAAPLIS